MKTMSNLLTTSAVVLMMSGTAYAQSNGDFLEGEAANSWMNDTDGDFYSDTYADTTDDSSSSTDATMPPMGEEVSLDQFDKYYESLVNEVDERLGQMSVTDDAKKETLQGPDVSQNQSELDQIAGSQREIRVLELKLEQAKLAKQLWTELSAESIDDLRANISSLESQIASVDEEHALEIEALEAENASTQEELEAASQELVDAQAEIEQLRAERDNAFRQAQQARQAPMERSAPQVPHSAGPSPVVPSEPLIVRPSARVQNIRLVGGRAQATLSYPGEISETVSVYDELRDGSRVTRIDRMGVEVEKSGQTYSLDRGSYTQPSAEEAGTDSGSSGFTSPYASDTSGEIFLEDAADAANP